MSRAVLAGFVLSVLALVGCGTLNDLIDLDADLRDAGYNATSTNLDTVNGYTVLYLDIAMSDKTPTEEDAEGVAEVVWTQYEGSFDELRVSFNGVNKLTATGSDLTEMFGERPAGLEPESSGGVNLTVAILVVVAVALVLTGLMFLVWWRGRRAPAPIPPPTHQLMYPTQLYPQHYQPPRFPPGPPDS